MSTVKVDPVLLLYIALTTRHGESPRCQLVESTNNGTFWKGCRLLVYDDFLVVPMRGRLCEEVASKFPSTRDLLGMHVFVAVEIFIFEVQQFSVTTPRIRPFQKRFSVDWIVS